MTRFGQFERSTDGAFTVHRTEKLSNDWSCGICSTMADTTDSVRIPQPAPVDEFVVQCLGALTRPAAAHPAPAQPVE